MGIFDQTIQTTTAPSTTMQANQLPQWVSEAGQNIYNQAAAISGQDFQPFGGQRVAGFDPQEQQAFDIAGQQVGAYQPMLEQAGQLAQMGGQQWSTDAAGQYMNPFNQAVLQRQAEELNRQFDINRMGDAARAASANAFGGSRQGILESETERSRNQAMQDMLLRGGSAAYDRALQAFQADKASGLQASGQLGQLGALGQQLGMADISQLMQTGGMQRGMEQQSLDTAYQDYLEQREYPYRQLNFLSGILQGAPYETRTTGTGMTTQVSPGTSPLAQIGGALTGLYGGYKMLNSPPR